VLVISTTFSHVTIRFYPWHSVLIRAFVAKRAVGGWRWRLALISLFEVRFQWANFSTSKILLTQRREAAKVLKEVRF
jgi:hypothetical protein